MDLKTTKPTGKAIWFVDDDTYILKIAGFIFKKHGLDHRCFESAEALLETPWDASVGYVISDIRLPGKNGNELCRLLRQQHSGELKIYALTTQASDSEQSAFSEDGFDAVFLKPFTESDLLTLLAEQDEKLSFPLLEALIEDELERAEILQQFLEETYHDLDLVERAKQQADLSTVTLIVHRIAGRLAQFSQEELSAEFRKLETEMRSYPETLPATRLEILTASLNAFLKKVPTVFS